MSHPLKRRIAQAALLVAAAGAAPMAVAGTASAADLVPPTDLGAGLTSTLDGAPSSSSTVQDAAHEFGQVAGATGAETVSTGVPLAADAAGKTVAHALPDTNESLGKVTSPAAKTASAVGTVSKLAAVAGPALAEKVGPAVTDKIAPSVTDKVVPATTRSASATTSPLGAAGGLLPTGGLPTSALPGTDALAGVTHVVPGADALTGLAHPAAENRLGGVPGLGGGSSPLDGLTGSLGPIGSLLGGVGGGGLPGLG
ncbi:hypothetical protein OG871_23225 [Kitasatospora sp. NBC_00374]|uniref:hypothetical protein n=1 Tax=Kitasatospora sp. NBC_00374 TaxID=2975964 RepID=UPI0030DFE96A